MALPNLSFTSNKQSSERATSGDVWTGGNTINIGMSPQDKENILIAAVVLAALYFLR